MALKGRLARTVLAEADVDAADGTTYLVRIMRDSPFDLGESKAPGDDPVSALYGLVRALSAMDQRGWRVRVVRPATAWRAERALFEQPIAAAAIVTDVACGVIDALLRGDRLWTDDR